MGVKGEDNRQRIVTAADNLFYKQGYNQTSFQDISEATNIPRGNFYYYFKTKDDILEAVVQARSADFTTLLKQFEETTSNSGERLLMLVDMMNARQESVIESGCPVGSLSSELAKDNTSLQDKSRLVFEVLHDWVAKQFGASGAEKADELAMDLLARMQGIIVMTCAFKDAVFLQRSLQELKDWVRSNTTQ